MNDHSQFQAELHQMAAEMLKKKQPDEVIISLLKQKGLQDYYAEMILGNVKTDMEDRKQFWRHVLSGSFVFLAGLTLTIGTYWMAGPEQTYYIFSGIMLVGITSILRGFILFRK